MAQADPKNTHGSAPEKLQRVTATHRKKHLGELERILRTIAKDRTEPKLQAEAIRIKLVRRIDYFRSTHARALHYGHFVEKNSDLRLGYLIRLTNNQLQIGQRRGSRSRATAREKAANIKNISQLDAIERRAFDILKGARHKPRKNLIEKRAIQLADITKRKWFYRRQTGRPKGKWTRKPDNPKARSADDPKSFEASKPRLTLTDVVSIAVPIIEEFAGKIRQPKEPFMALWHVACAYSEVITRHTQQRDLSISKKTVQQALSRARRKLRNSKSLAGENANFLHRTHTSDQLFALHPIVKLLK